jgi:hypothetical protein
MARPKLEITTGKVVDVQISEKRLEDPAPDPRRRGRPGKPGTVITGRLRLFIDGPGLNDPHFDFDRCELAVHRDQEVAFARVVPRKRDQPINMMLLNKSAGTVCEFADGLAAYLGKPFFGPKWKAVGLSLAMFVIGYLLSRFIMSPDRGPLWWTWWPLLFSFLAYWVFWGAMILYDNWSYHDRWNRLRKSLRARLEASTAPTPDSIAAPPAAPALEAPAPAAPQPQA